MISTLNILEQPSFNSGPNHLVHEVTAAAHSGLKRELNAHNFSFYHQEGSAGVVRLQFIYT